MLAFPQCANVAFKELGHVVDPGRYGVDLIQAILSCVFEGLMVPIDAGLRIEARYFTSLILDPTACNMVRSLFINKGKADKLARRPEGNL